MDRRSAEIEAAQQGWPDAAARLAALVALECSHGQGCHLGRPGGADAIAALRRHATLR